VWIAGSWHRNGSCNLSTNNLLGKAGDLAKKTLSSTAASLQGKKPNSAISGLSTVDSSTVMSSDTFFRFSKLNNTNFNKSLSYEFQIVDKSKGVIAVYTFPIPPQAIQKSVPSTETLEATMKGIYSTANGAPFRQISIAGTSGTIHPTAPNSAANNAGTSDILKFAFKNTIKSIDNLQNQANAALNAVKVAFGADAAFNAPLNYSSDAGLLTGYQTIHDMTRFFDYYLAGKKLAANKGWRLVFLMNKDNEYYACSLNSYSINKSAGTNEYSYNINLIAYKRYPNVKSIGKVSIPKAPSKPVTNKMSAALVALRRARDTVAGVHGVLSGIRSDIHDSLVTPMGQATAFARELGSATKTVGDYVWNSTFIKQDLREPLRQYFSNSWSVNQDVIITIDRTSASNDITTATTNSKLNDGQPDDYTKPGDSSDPFDAFLDNAVKHPEILDKIPMESLTLSPNEQEALDLIDASIDSLTSADMIAKRKMVEDFSRSISESFGGGSSSYNLSKGYGSVTKTYKKLTTDDINLLNELNNAISAMDSIIAVMDDTETTQDDYFKFYSDYAVSSGIRFEQNSQSRFLVPFPLNGTLEQVAMKYLGSSERWVELAALNALKAPYVDEEGTYVTVTSSVGGDTLSVASPFGFYVGQTVEISSDNERATVRKIKSIDVVNAISTLLTFEPGQTLLSIYKVSQNAKIKVYAPDTINSSMLIAIPSLIPPNFTSMLKTSPEVSDLTGIARMAKVDFLLDQNGDMVFSSAGDVKLAYGMTNLIQAALMKIKTNTNTLLQDPGFGNPVQVGQPNSEIDVKEVMRSLEQSFANDPRFAGVSGGEVQLKGTSIDIKLLVEISDTSISLPIGAEIPR
jgi:hypothetical protein